MMLLEPREKQPVVEPVRVSPDYGKFINEPLPHGFGATLGNALRRTLLSSVPGVAITRARIEGVSHEFTTLPGVLEDMTELILNLKGVAFQAVQPHVLELDTNNKVKKREWHARIEAQGKGEVTGADVEIVEGPEIKVVNPGYHLATLTADDARLNIELTIETGVGYVAADKQDSTQLPLGVIPVDSMFTPVQRVNHHVESTRVGHQTDLDRLILEIWTNAAMTPYDALKTSAQILIRYLCLFLDFGSEPSEDMLTGARVGGGDTAAAGGEVLGSKIEELDFSVRTYNCLKKENINSIGELVRLSEKQLLEIRNLGSKSLTEIQEKLAERGLGLASDEG